MADVSKIKLPDNTTLNIKDYRIPGIDTTPTSGSSNVVTSGGIKTAIDNVSLTKGTTTGSGNAVTDISVSGKTITLTKGSKFFKDGDILQSTNPFNALPKDLYISKIDNALYAADKRFTVSGELSDGTTTTSVTSGQLAGLFNGSYEDGYLIRDGKTLVIHITFNGWPNSQFPNYPYGYFFLSFYYVCKPASVSARCYCNYQSQGIGWHDMTVTNLSSSTGSANLYQIYNGYFAISEFEFTIVGDTTNSYGYTNLCQLELKLTRPEPSRTPFVSKYTAEELYYPLTAPSFIKKGGTSSQFLKADGSVDSNTYLTSSSLSSYAPLASPALTGTPTAPTAAAGTNTTQIATTAFVNTAVNNAVGSVYRVKGTKANYASLPSSGNIAGDVWNVTAAYGNYPAGTNWVWTGSEWDALGGEIDLSSKQDVLTWDTVPTENSTNPVTSGGIYQVIVDNEEVTAAALCDLDSRVVDLEANGGQVIVIDVGNIGYSGIAQLSSGTYDLCYDAVSDGKSVILRTDDIDFLFVGYYGNDDLYFSATAQNISTSKIMNISVSLDDTDLLTIHNASADENVIESISVNGSTVVPINKNVDLTIPPIVSDVKLNGTSLTKDANNAVNVQAVTGITVNGTSQTLNNGVAAITIPAGVWSEGTGTNAAILTGSNSTAAGANSVAEGQYTQTTNPAEHAEGMYNASHTGSTTAAKTISSIGIGDSTTRSNALEVMQNGYVYLNGIGEYDGTNPTTSESLQQYLNNNEYVVATAFNDLNDRLIDVETNKQETLVSGTNLKTVNGVSLLGSGNLYIEGGGGSGGVGSVKVGTTEYLPTDGVVSLPAYPSTPAAVNAQAVLVSGTNIKTINNESILGSGNITISGGSASVDSLTTSEIDTIWNNAT